MEHVKTLANRSGSGLFRELYALYYTYDIFH